VTADPLSRPDALDAAPSPGPRDPELAALAEQSRQQGRRALPQLTVAEARARTTQGNQLCSDGPRTGLTVDEHTATVDGRAITLRIYRPEKPSLATVVYFHGGGWITGDLDYGDELCRFLTVDASCTVVSVDYRLSPEHPFPVPLDDAYAALIWIDRNRRDATPLIVAGDSAGGNLAAACTLRAREERGGPAIDAQVLIYPVTDVNLDRPSYRRCAEGFPIGRADMEHCFNLYVPRPEQRTLPEVAPLRAASHRHLPPAVVVVAGHDPLRDEGIAYAERLRAADVPVRLLDFPDLCHAFLRFSRVSAAVRRARSAIIEAVRVLIAQLSAAPAGTPNMKP